MRHAKELCGTWGGRKRGWYARRRAADDQVFWPRQYGHGLGQDRQRSEGLRVRPERERLAPGFQRPERGPDRLRVPALVEHRTGKRRGIMGERVRYGSATAGMIFSANVCGGVISYAFSMSRSHPT